MMRDMENYVEEVISKDEELTETNHYSVIVNYGHNLMNRFERAKNTDDKLDTIVRTILLSIVTKLPPREARRLIGRVRKRG
jgi:hypothetical protein